MYNVHIIMHAWSIMLLRRANGVHESGPHHYITYVSVGHYSQPKCTWLQDLIPLVQCYIYMLLQFHTILPFDKQNPIT